MEVKTTFKESVAEIKNYKSIVLAIEEFSIGQDHTYSDSELKEIVKKAQSLDVKVSVLVNKMIFDDEVDALIKKLELLKKLEVDSIFFSDMAVFMLAKDLKIEHLLIYAPGMTIVNSLDVKEYLKLNIQAVELANELTLSEKITIAKANPNKVGLVISGYLLMSFSKRQALSNYFSQINKSVNVENNYNLSLIEATRENKMPIYEDFSGTFIYSEYILDSFKYIDQLLDADFKYFRIDGIFLEPKMIKDLLKAYKQTINDKKAIKASEEIKNKYSNFIFDDTSYRIKTSEVK